MVGVHTAYRIVTRVEGLFKSERDEQNGLMGSKSTKNILIINNACIFKKTKQRRLKDFAASKAIQRPSSANYDIKSNHCNSIITRCRICTAGAACFKKDHNIPIKYKAALCCLKKISSHRLVYPREKKSFTYATKRKMTVMIKYTLFMNYNT